jgi:hypothetical protein
VTPERETGQTYRKKEKINLVWGLAFSSPDFIPPMLRLIFSNSWCVPNDTTEVEVQVGNTNTFFFLLLLLYFSVYHACSSLASRISHTAGVIYTHSHPQLSGSPTPPQRHTKTTRSHKTLLIFI